MEVNFFERHLLADLLTDPVEISVIDANIRDKKHPRVDRFFVAQAGIDVVLPGSLSGSKVQHAQAHFALLQDKHRSSHQGVDQVGDTFSDLLGTCQEIEVIHDEACVYFLLHFLETREDLFRALARFGHPAGFDG